MPDSPCPKCASWGPTLTAEDREGAVGVVPCPDCKRPTHPNLGVNCPAGCAVSFGAGNNLFRKPTPEQVVQATLDGLPRRRRGFR